MNRILSVLIVHVCLGLHALAVEPIAAQYSLADGSVIKGRVMSATASEATVMTDFGVLRIALDKFSAESRAKIQETSKPDTAALLARIAELEAKVSQLQQENEALRKTSVPTATVRPNAFTSGGATTSPTVKEAAGAEGLQYTMSSTGKRHNSNCRYFGSGRACSATSGVACKICGG